MITHTPPPIVLSDEDHARQRREAGANRINFLMKPSLLLFLPILASAAEITLTSPLDHQVIQRHSSTEGTVLIRGTQSGIDASKTKIEAKIGAKGRWQALSAQIEKEQFSASVMAPAGGWHRVEVRAMLDGNAVATAVDMEARARDILGEEAERGANHCALGVIAHVVVERQAHEPLALDGRKAIFAVESAICCPGDARV